MPYNANIPNAGDLLSVSQQQIKDNFNTANTAYGTDHYAFTDTTANAGKHNLVTTPLIVGSAHPATAANELKFYAMQDLAALGVLQYSRGGSNAPPTPVTHLQSPTAPITLAIGASTNIFDANGLNLFFGLISATDTVVTATSTLAYVCFKGAPTNAWSIDIVSPASRLEFQSSGTTLLLKNVSGSTATNNVFWSLDILRINK